MSDSLTESTQTDTESRSNQQAGFSLPPRRKIFAALEGYAYLAPTLIALTIFVYVPIISSFQLSLNRAAPFGNATRYVGLENYATLLDRSFNIERLMIWLPIVLVIILASTGLTVFARRTPSATADSLARAGRWVTTIAAVVLLIATVEGTMRTSLLFTLGTVLPSIFLSVALAIALSLPVRRFSWFHRLLIFVPIVISSAVTGVLFRWIYHPVVGYINYALSLIGIDGPNWLSDADWALVAVMMAVVWRQLGFNVIIALAGLQNIDATYYEAAKVDGANLWFRIRHITLPLMSPTLFFLFIINTINSLQTFGEIDVLTMGGPGEATKTLLYSIYFFAFRGTPQRGIASAESFILFLLIVILSIIQFRVANRRVHYR